MEPEVRVDGNVFRDPSHSDAYVVDARGEPRGMAIYLGDDLLITCAHVVAEAMGDTRAKTDPDPPEEDIAIRFFRTTNETIKAQVKEWFPYIPDEEARTVSDPDLSDIAILRLNEGKLDKCTAEPALFTDADPTQFADSLRFYGNTSSKPNGGWVTARDNGRVEKGRYDLVTADGEDNIVEGGCSGSLVFDCYHGRCIGMIDARLGNNKAYMIPTEILVEVCEEIVPELPQNAAMKAQYQQALRLLNRARERSLMRKLLERLVRESALRPVVCTVSGIMKSWPEMLIECFIQDTFKKVLDPSFGHVGLKKGRLKDDGELMRSQLAEYIGFRSDLTDPRTLAEEMQKNQQILALATRISVEEFDYMQDALEEYMDFLCEIAACKPNTLFFQFFLIECDDDEWDESEADEVLKVIKSGCAKADPMELEGPIVMGPLSRVRKRHITDFIDEILSPMFVGTPGFDTRTFKNQILEKEDRDFEFSTAYDILDKQISSVIGNA